MTTIEYSKWGGLYFDCAKIKGARFEVGEQFTLKGYFLTGLNPDVCYEINQTYTLTKIGATNPNTNLTIATWE